MTAAGAYSAMPPGVLVAGYLLDGVGLSPTLLLVAVCYVTTTLTLLVNPAIRDMDPPVPASTRGPGR